MTLEEVRAELQRRGVLNDQSKWPSKEEMQKAVMQRRGAGVVGGPGGMIQAPEEIQGLAGASGTQQAIKSALAGGLQGMTLGFADELAGLVGQKDRARKFFDQAYKDSPAAYMAGDLGSGALLGGAGLSRGMMKAAAPAGYRSIGNFLKSSIPLSTAQGAAAGVGYSQGENVKDNAIAGGLMAGGLSGLVGSIVPALRKAKSYIPFVDHDISAARRLKKNFRESDEMASLTGQKPGIKERQTLIDSHPSMALADTNPVLSEALSEAAHISPESARRVVAGTSMRHQDQALRFQGYLNDTLGTDLPPGENIYSRLRKNAEDARELADGLYKEAYSTPFEPTRNMIESMRTPAGNAAAKDALKALKNKPVNERYDSLIMDEDGKLLINPNSLQAWDQIQRSLSDKANSLKVRGKREAARDMGNMADAVIKDLTDNGPEAYREARKLWAQKMGMEGTVELAKKADNMPFREFVEEWEGLSKGEQDMFKAAYLNNMEEKMMGKTPDQSIHRLFNKDKTQGILNTILPEDAYKSLKANMALEELMEQTFNRSKSAHLVGQPYRIGMHQERLPSTVAGTYRRGVREGLVSLYRHGLRQQAGYLTDALLDRDGGATELLKLLDPSAFGPKLGMAAGGMVRPSQ